MVAIEPARRWGSMLFWFQLAGACEINYRIRVDRSGNEETMDIEPSTICLFTWNSAKIGSFTELGPDFERSSIMALRSI